MKVANIAPFISDFNIQYIQLLVVQGFWNGVKEATAGRSAKERPTGVNANGRGYGLDDGTPCASVCHGARSTALSWDARRYTRMRPLAVKRPGLPGIL
ncbi:hypothetical protein [Xenorhabdus mauleonii]|uniref:hypothetical protein n=1 Tax=Xenorhabdus mauleonii TaxID=351675 RepID=UPI000B8202D0|nr:hypothetical protein [Xenorhabdus mauleonii]